MFNLELICSDGIYQVCDDVFSEKLSIEQAKECVFELCKRFKDEDVYATSADISFNFCRYHLNNEEKENVKFNINLFWHACGDVAEMIYDVYHNVQNDICPNYWAMLMNTTSALFQLCYNF